MEPTLDDVWTDPDFSELPDGAVLRRRRRYRIAMVGAIGVSYAIDTVLLVLYGWVGKVSQAVIVGYACAGLVHVALFSALHWSGISDRARNPHLTGWQMVVSIAVQLTAMTFAPAIKAYFLGLIFIVFSFGALRISIRSALALWLSTCVAAAWALAAYPSTVAAAVSSTTPMQAIVVGASFSLILLRCLLLNYYATVLRMRMMQHTVSLSEQVRAARELATHDRLTGALNRHAILPLLDDQIHLRVRKNVASVLALIDIDHFKSINDRLGHIAGDTVLRQLVVAMQNCVRPTDKIARYGGEEFLLLMPSTTLAEGCDVAERMRETVAKFDWRAKSLDLELTISVGVTEIGAGDTTDAALARADACMYRAKNAGRNLTVWLPAGRPAEEALEVPRPRSEPGEQLAR